MRRKLVIVCIIAAGTIAVSCSAKQMPPSPQIGPPNITSMSAYFELADKKWWFHVSSEAVEGTPTWPDPTTMDPPLSVVEAIKISRAELASYYPDEPVWNLLEVSLHTFGVGQEWFYMVEWRPRDVTTGDGLSIPVLMDGRALPLNRGMIHSPCCAF